MKSENELKYEVCLKEYENCIERNNSLNTKISILIATEVLMICNYFSIGMGKNNIGYGCTFKTLITIENVLVIISMFMQFYILYMRGEYNLLNCGIFNPNKDNYGNREDIIKNLVDDIKVILDDRNENYQKKTIIFNASIAFFATSLVIETGMFLLM